MTTPAKVGSIDALRQFRMAMVKFAETADAAMGDAESEVQRVTSWVEHEQASYWAGQARKRQEALVKAKEALRFKQVFKDATGARQATIEEEKAVALATRRLAEADQKIANTKRWSRQLEKEFHAYKGSVQRLGTAVASDIPLAMAKLDRMFIALQAYVSFGSPAEVTSSAGPAPVDSMARGDTAPLKPGDIYRALRQLTPVPELRSAATPGDPARAPWLAGDLPSADLETLATLALEQQLIDPDSIVTFATGVWEASRIYLHRQVPVFPGDSGWHIGPADASPQAVETAKASDMTRARPAFAQILPLSAGTLVAIDSAGIASILNAADEELWSSKNLSRE